MFNEGEGRIQVLVWSSGMVGSGAYLGFAHSLSPPDNLVTSLAERPPDGGAHYTVFKQVAEHWYLYKSR